MLESQEPVLTWETHAIDSPLTLVGLANFQSPASQVASLISGLPCDVWAV